MDEPHGSRLRSRGPGRIGIGKGLNANSAQQSGELDVGNVREAQLEPDLSGFEGRLEDIRLVPKPLPSGEVLLEGEHEPFYIGQPEGWKGLAHVLRVVDGRGKEGHDLSTSPHAGKHPLVPEGGGR